MSDSKELPTTTELISQATDSPLLAICPVCGRQPAEGLVPLALLDQQLRAFVKANALLGESAGSCSQCIALFERGRKQIEGHGAIFEQTSYVLPTPLRLNADEIYRTWRHNSVLDSGFYGSPDLTQQTIASRLSQHFDPCSLSVAKGVLQLDGMRTSVVAAGNGHFSEGFIAGSLRTQSRGEDCRTGRFPRTKTRTEMDYDTGGNKIRSLTFLQGGIRKTLFPSSLGTTV